MAASDARAAAGEPEVRQDDAEAFKLQQLKAMEQPSWNEGRLDDLSAKVDALDRKVDRGFEKVDKRFEKVDERFEKVDEEFKTVRKEMKEGFERMEDRFSRMQWTLFVSAMGIIIALIGGPHL